MHERNYWIGVVSRDHVAIGVGGGFAQLNHGKAGPLERMRAGDGFAYYSPRTVLSGRRAAAGLYRAWAHPRRQYFPGRQ